MHWIALFVAGVLEICWAVGMKLSNGFTNPSWTGFTLVTLALSMGLLAYAIRLLPMGTAYGVWTGIGAVGTAVVGILVFGESSSPSRLFFLGLIVMGIIGLKSVTPSG